MVDIAFRSATDLTAAIQAREVSSRELLEHYLQRVERLNPKLNAVVTLAVDAARERAAAADQALARGETWGPLHGLPMTIKDVYETAGIRTTCGIDTLADHVPSANAVAVQRLVDSGAIIFGKTNVPVAAADWQSYNPIFGTSNNPWDLGRTPGGSSGGAAAALAAGLTPLELGSDIGGSIRVPSHFCGVYGHKPTYGLIPTRGHIPGPPGLLAETDINVAGPLARSPADLDLALDILAGPLPERALAWRLELPGPRRASLSDYRVAAWLNDPASPVDAAVEERLRAAVAALRGAGVKVDETARPGFSLADADQTFTKLLRATMSPGVGPTDESSPPRLQPPAPAQQPPPITHGEWLSANEMRLRYQAQLAAFFRDHDLLLCPVGPVAAFPHDHTLFQTRTLAVSGEARPYSEPMAWLGFVGMTYLPATVAPIGRTPDGLPVGIQIVGPYLEDRTTIDFARRLTDVIGGFEAPPGY